MNIGITRLHTLSIRWSLLMGLWLLGAIPLASFGQEDCIGRGFNLGHPIDDYRDLSEGVRHHLKLVENAHFTPTIEQLRFARAGGGTVAANIDYTLRRFPNHHRALYAATRLQRRDGPPPVTYRNPAGFYPSAECYLERAARFTPNDPMVHMIHGIHLHLTGHPQAALSAYKTSEKLYPDSPELQYNMGLLYYDMGQYDTAKKYALKAYKKGYPLPGLRLKLSKMDRWP